MSYTYRTWTNADYYNFSIEFNRIESYNEYCKRWLKYFDIDVAFTSKTDWTINDIVDINDFNRVKNNINIILNAIDSSSDRLNISNQYNQVWTLEKANELELRLKEYLSIIGQLQFMFKITGLANCGENLRLSGVN